MVSVLTFFFLWSKSLCLWSRSSRGRPLSHSLHHVMKHCKGSAFLRGSVKSDPLDAWGEESELEIEGGRLINPPPLCFNRDQSRDVKKRRRQRKKIFEKLPRVRCHTASCVDWAALFVIHGHEYWVDVRGRKKNKRIKKKIVAHVCIWQK